MKKKKTYAYSFAFFYKKPVIVLSFAGAIIVESEGCQCFNGISWGVKLISVRPVQ